MALSGSFRTTGYTTSSGAPYYLEFSWTAQQSIEENKSVISWVVKAGGGNTGYHNTVSKRYAKVGETVKTGGNDWIDSSAMTVYNDTVIFSGTETVYHNADGTGSFKADVKAAIEVSFVGLNYQYNTSGSETFTLNQIPRAANIIAASDFNDQENPQLQYSNPAGSIAALSGAIAFDSAGTSLAAAFRTVPSDGGSYVFVLTDTEKNALRNACLSASKTVYFILKTVIGAHEEVKYLAKSFSLADVADNRPSVSISVSPDNSAIPLSGRSAFSSLYIQNISKASVSISASAKFSASIASYLSTLNGASYSVSSFVSSEITAAGTVPLVSTAVDSRGLIGTSQQDLTVIPYTNPFLSIVEVYRCSALGVKQNDGEYLKVTATKNYSAVNGLNYAVLRCRTKRANESWSSQAWTTLLDRDSRSNVFSGVISGTFSKTVEFTVQVSCIDDIGKEDLLEFNIPTEHVNLHLKKNKRGVGIGKYCDADDELQVAYEATFDDDVNVSGDVSIEGSIDAASMSQAMLASMKEYIRDLCYPVGSFWVSESSTDPETVIGGTWSRVKDVFLLAAGDDYAAGSTGGEAEHVLTVNEMPSHTHNVSAVKWEKPSSWCSIDEYYGNVSSGVTSGSAGGDQAHNNMPPYLAVYVWKRTA